MCVVPVLVIKFNFFVVSSKLNIFFEREPIMKKNIKSSV